MQSKLIDKSPLMNANHQSGSPNELSDARPKDHRRRKIKHSLENMPHRCCYGVPQTPYQRTTTLPTTQHKNLRDEIKASKHGM